MPANGPTDKSADKPAHPDHISMLEKRRIEAALIGEFYEVLKDRLGRDEAQEIIRVTVAASAVTQGGEFRAAFDHEPDLQDFASHLHLWEKDAALDRNILHKSPERLDYNITRCAYAEMYRDMGLGNIGHLLSCNRDGAFCTGFSEDIELTRTQTIMAGADFCDFRYTLKRK